MGRRTNGTSDQCHAPKTRCHEHITPVLQNLEWLPVPKHNSKFSSSPIKPSTTRPFPIEQHCCTTTNLNLYPPLNRCQPYAPTFRIMYRTLADRAVFIVAPSTGTRSQFKSVTALTSQHTNPWWKHTFLEALNDALNRLHLLFYPAFTVLHCL